MKQLNRNLKLVLMVFLAISLGLLIMIIHHQQKSKRVLAVAAGENKYSLARRYGQAGSIYTKDQVRLAYSEDGKRYYAEDEVLARASLHLVGDYTHNIAGTLESLYQGELLGNRGTLRQLLADVKGQGRKGDDLHLSLDSQAMKAAYLALADYKGAVCIYNYQTGAILAMVSTPSTSPDNVINWENIEDTALFNRALYARYSPGSTFKIVTSLAYLTSPNQKDDFTVYCKGEEPLIGPGSVFENHEGAGHGEVGLEQAFAQSCNHFFGQVGIDLGNKKLEAKAKEFAFNQSYQIDRFSMNPAVYQGFDHDLKSLSWQAIGQPIGEWKLSLNPVHLASLAASIANSGKAVQPYLLDYVEMQDQSRYLEAQSKLAYQIKNSQAEIDRVKGAMFAAVETGLAQGLELEGYRIGAKTGTAEWLDSEGKLEKNSLLTAFIDDPSQPYALGLVLESSDNAVAVAALILSQILP